MKEIRHGEATTAAAALGADFRSLDLGDYPLVIDAAAVDRLRDLICELAPNVILTHAALDPFNPDHGVAHEATVQARQLASGAGVASAFKTIAPPELLLFEPHQPELCGFVPTTFLDITPVWEKKVAAMDAMGAQGYLKQYYSERARASRESRAAHLRPQRHPLRGGVPARDPRRRRRAVTDYAALAQLGVATVHEAAGRVGIIDLELTQVVPGSRVAGPGAHRALRSRRQLDGARGGRARGARRRARADERRAGAGRARRRAARDAGAGARRRGDPRRRRRARPRRARRDRPADLGALRARAGRDEGRRSASSTCRSSIGGTEIRPGDLVVLDCDGAMALPRRARRRGAAARARARASASARCASATRPASSRTT